MRKRLKVASGFQSIDSPSFILAVLFCSVPFCSVLIHPLVLHRLILAGWLIIR